MSVVSIIPCLFIFLSKNTEENNLFRIILKVFSKSLKNASLKLSFTIEKAYDSK